MSRDTDFIAGVTLTAVVAGIGAVILWLFVALGANPWTFVAAWIGTGIAAFCGLYLLLLIGVRIIVRQAVEDLKSHVDR